MPPVTAQDIITNSLLEMGAYSQGETPSSADITFGLSKLNRLFDAWNAKELNIYRVDFLRYTLVPSVQPLTIGQAFSITQAVLNANVATYTANNSFKAGDLVSVQGCTTAAFNFTSQIVATATPTQFTVNIVNANIPTEPESGALAAFAAAGGFPNYATRGQRPAMVVNCNIILNNVSPFVKIPVRVHNGKSGADWWAANPVPQITTTLPTDLYYDPQWPFGNLYFWPMQTTAYDFEAEVWSNLIEDAAITDTFWLPQGYEDAVTYSLAESLCPAFGKQLSPVLANAAIKARAIIQNLNSQAPTIKTRDEGIPSRTHDRPYFNWRVGMTTTR